MNTSIVGLRKNMTDVTKALARQESVTIFSHGKPFAIMHPYSTSKKTKLKKSSKNHPFFGMLEHENTSVDEVMDNLRGSRI